MTRFMHLALALGSLAAPAAASAQSIALPTTSFTLSNGMRVVVHEDHAAPLVAVNVWYHVGSGREVPGRSGFAHLFEHMMFQGSANVGDDQHFRLVQEAGGTLNGSTNADRTNYYETLPSNQLALALWLEADRMGFLLPAMTQEKLDNQRDVVKNERRQNYENRPYGSSGIRANELLYPEGHPYHRPTIGYQQDLTDASMGDVQEFFRQWYVPSNASLVVAGDVKPDEVRRLAERYFGSLPAGPVPPRLSPRPVTLDADRREVLEDRVTLAEIQLVWPTAAAWSADDAPLVLLARILGGGKTGRLHERLVYREQKAQDAEANAFGRELAGQLTVRVRAREGVSLAEMERAALEEVRRIAEQGVEAEELARAQARYEAEFISGLQTLTARADRLNSYTTFRGGPDMVNDDIARFRAVTPADVQRVAQRYLLGPKVALATVPLGRRELAAPPGATP